MTGEMKTYGRIGETLHSWEHPSGLRVMVVPKTDYQKKTAIFATSYGSIDNVFRKPGGEAPIEVPDGIAHFLEHKLFEQKDMNVLEKFSRLGASPNAFTSFHETAYYFTCTDRFEENFDLLLDFVQHPWLTDENVEKEKGIIGQEIRMYDDSAEWRVFFNMLAAMYAEHPVRLDIAGTVESIAGITKELLYDCYHTFYSPSNMAVAVVGDVDPEAIFAAVDRMIESRENRGRVEKVYPVEKPGVPKSFTEQRLAVSMPLFMLGWRDDVRASGEALLRRRTALSIALAAIAGRSSDTYSELYAVGLVNESFEHEITALPAFAFASMAGQSPEPEAAAARLRAAVDRAVAEGISEEAFIRVKRAQEGAFIRSLNASDHLARELVDSWFADACHLDLGEIFGSITLEETNEMLRQALSGAPVLSVVRPLAGETSEEAE